VRLTVNLLPLLNHAKSPRVLSVLAGGQEKPIFTQDLALVHNYSILNAINHATTMQTLAFEYLAKGNPSVSFVHAYPGWVNTDIVTNFLTPNPGAWYGFQGVLYPVVKGLISLFLLLVGTSVEEAGERQAFYATSDRYPSARELEAGTITDKVARCSVCGNGVYRLRWNGESVDDDTVLGPYRREGLPEKIWEHTVGIFEKALVESGIYH
jgi:hypothetical protein